jgi:rifampin ADP-ribosylating transferase
MTYAADATPPFYHGTRADVKPGDLIAPGHASNYGKRKQASWVYLTGTLDAAIWGAEPAVGDGPGRIYVVEPTGEIIDDPNLTDKKFPGNPTKSYRSREPLQVTGEITDWQGRSPEQLKAMKDHIGARRRGDRLIRPSPHSRHLACGAERPAINACLTMIP